MICYLCQKPIRKGSRVEFHHPVYKSKGGTETKLTHHACHRQHHSSQGDFKAWGKMSALSLAWSCNLLNVRNHPAYSLHRAYYVSLYKGGATV
jgi:hypothetical protein